MNPGPVTINLRVHQAWWLAPLLSAIAWLYARGMPVSRQLLERLVRLGVRTEIVNAKQQGKDDAPALRQWH